MRLTKLLLQDYRAFAGKQEVEIRRLNIIIGRNNSGKSALLNAPLLMQHLANGASLQDALQHISSSPIPLNAFHGKPYVGAMSLGANWLFEDGDLTIPTQDELIVYTPEELEKTSKLLIENIDSIFFKQSYQILPPNRTIEESRTLYTLTYKNPTLTTFKTTKPNQIETITTLHILESNITNQINRKIKSQKSIKLKNQAKKHKSRQLSENTSYLYLKNINEEKNPFEALNSSTNHDWNLFEQVSNWYKNHMGKWKLKKEEFDGYYTFRLIPPRGSDAYRESYTVDFEDAGTGMSAVLPIVVLSHLWRVNGAYLDDVLPAATFVAEEPEHHLHPAAHGPLADLFVDLVTHDSPHTVMVETHSEVFCLRVQRRVADKTLKPDDVIIHWMDDRSEPGMTHIVPIYIDEHGDTYRVDEAGQRVHFWPPGIFSEDYDEIREIEKLRSESKG